MQNLLILTMSYVLGKTQVAEPGYGCSAAAALLLVWHTMCYHLAKHIVVEVWLDITMNTTCNAKQGLLLPVAAAPATCDMAVLLFDNQGSWM